MINLSEAVDKIKKVGSKNVRIVPMSGQPAIEGKHQIDILQDGKWVTIVEGTTLQMAEDIVRQAINRLIIG